MTHMLSPRGRALIMKAADEALKRKYPGRDDLTVTDEGCVFITHRNPETKAWCRVVRTYGRCLVAFVHEHKSSKYNPHYRTAFVAPGEALPIMFYDHKQFDSVKSHDRAVYEWLLNNGARSFDGRGWHQQMGEAMADLAAEWESPWSP